jgi:tetratricopeptide (TPR) repeat protein
MGGVTLDPGACIGPYRYERPIGRGGMSHVLLGRDPGGASVALKVLKANCFRTGLARFRREFRALARLKHPNVIRVEAYGDIHGHPYIAMEYIKGVDLYQEIRDFPRTQLAKRWARVEEVLIDLARALSYIHQRGLIHRDLKPSNVLIDVDGVCKLTDFGIVKELDPDGDAQLSTTLVGTWAYASPEQITGGAIDNRSDLYSLGVILYTMLTGRRPFVAKDMSGYLEMHRDHTPTPPHRLVPTVPPRLDQICMRLLEKDPRNRLQSASEILYRLEQIDLSSTPHTANDGDAWSPKLVGREAMVDTLRDAVSALTRGEGKVVLLEGGEGMGKSRLVAAAVHHARLMGMPVHRAQVVAGSGAFEALVEIGRQIGDEMGSDASPELAQAVKRFAQGQGRIDGDARYQLFDRLRDAFSELLNFGPRIIVLDDFHHAPGPLVDLLGYLVRSILARDSKPLLVLLAVDTSRKSPLIDGVRDGTALSIKPRRLVLEPLTQADVSRMVDTMLGEGRVASQLAQILHDETEGNPFFVAECLRSLIQQGVIVKRSGKGYRLTVNASDLANGTLAIPPGVRQVIRNRLAPLDPLDREVVDTLGVCGGETELEIVLDVVGLAEERALDAVDRLVEEGIIIERRLGEQTLLDVSQRKVREVAYQELEAGWRGTLHRRIAVALELRHPGSPMVSERIGEHYRRAGERGKAYRYLATSALNLWERALVAEAWAVSETAMLLSEGAQVALERPAYLRSRLKLLRVRANVTYNRGEWKHAEQVLSSLEETANSLGDERTMAEARLHGGIVLRRLGRSADGERSIAAVVDQARATGDRRTLIDGLRYLSIIAWEKGDLDECEALASRGLVAATGANVEEGRAGILVALTAVQAERGLLAAATSGLTEAGGIFQRLGNKRSNCVVLCNLAELLLWQGEIGQALARGAAALELARDVQYRVGESAAHRIRAMALLDAGDLVAAGADLERALEISDRQGLPEDIVSTRFLVGRLALRMDDAAGSESHLRVALSHAEEGDPESYSLLLKTMLARALSVQSKHDQGRQILEEIDGQLSDLAIPRATQVRVVTALAWRALGEDEKALHSATVAAQMASKGGFRMWSLYALMTIAEVGKGVVRDEAHAEAVGLAREICRALSPELADHFRRRRGIGALLVEG